MLEYLGCMTEFHFNIWRIFEEISVYYNRIVQNYIDDSYGQISCKILGCLHGIFCIYIWHKLVFFKAFPYKFVKCISNSGAFGLNFSVGICFKFVGIIKKLQKLIFIN